MKRLLAAIALAAALLLTLTACQLFPWAHSECAPHGGLSHIVKLGNNYFGICKDGKWVSP